MALCEMDEDRCRSPRETARATAVAALLGKSLRERVQVLDVGCGDGYLCRKLFGGLAEKEVDAVDPSLTPDRLPQLLRAPGIRFSAELPPARNRYDLTLLLDVLERVEDDRRYLKQIVQQHVAVGGRVLVTVPAFRLLYSGDDWFHGRYRRYSVNEVEQLAGSAGLCVLASGYLFGSLLAPKLLQCNPLRWGRVREARRWKGGAFLGALLGGMLGLENRAMIWLAKAGVTLPGATAWALCENRSRPN